MKPFIRLLAKNILIQLLSFAIILVGVGMVYAWASIDRNTAGVGQPLTSTMMQGIIDRVNDALVPSGAVIAFNLASCPVGWSMADGTGGRPDLRGEFIRGLDNGRWVDNLRTLGSWQEASSINDLVTSAGGILVNSGDSTTAGPTRISMGVTDVSRSSNVITVRPRNIALLYCIKN